MAQPTRPGTPPGGAARAVCGRRTSTCRRRTRAIPSGMSAFGRWMYGPWFWPPAKDAKFPPIANPYYDPNCDPNMAAVLRAGADPVDAEHLGRHGGVQRHADRQRHGVSDHHRRSEGLPLPDPERGQRPLLEPVLVRRRPEDRHAQRSRPEADRAGCRADRPGRLPDAGHDVQPEGPGLDPDRHRGRVPADPGRRAGARPPPGSPTRPGSTSATSTSTRCCWHRPSEPTWSSTSRSSAARR